MGRIMWSWGRSWGAPLPGSILAIFGGRVCRRVAGGWGSVPGFDGGYFEGGEWVGWVEDLGMGRDGDGEEYD